MKSNEETESKTSLSTTLGKNGGTGGLASADTGASSANIPVECHPLEPFLPKNAWLLMLGSFRHQNSDGAWISSILTS